MGSFDIAGILRSLPGVLIGLILHEVAHGYMAYCLGDNTAKDDGRLTLNPLRHLDPLGFILIVIAGFGWAKPVVFNPNNLKKKHRDEILIALAGPVANFLIALLFFCLARLLYIHPFFYSTELGFNIVQFLLFTGMINLGLFVFNLIPIPPLDGSHIYMTFVKKVNIQLMNTLYWGGTIILLAIVLIQNFAKVEILPIGSMINYFADLFIRILHF